MQVRWNIKVCVILDAYFWEAFNISEAKHLGAFLRAIWASYNIGNFPGHCIPDINIFELFHGEKGKRGCPYCCQQSKREG